MWSKRAIVLASLLLTAAITGCQNDNSPQPAPAEAPAMPTTASAASATSVQAASSIADHASTNTAISIVPAELQSCGNAVVTIKWDAGKAGISAAETEIWVGSSADDLKLFSAGGAAGEAQTGPWARPGSYFVLKNKADGKEIGHAVVAGPVCP
jgi:hypothetical protein